jgi:uncharacterized protein (TIGR03067 family)
MRGRLIFSVFCFILLTAFAPAPLPRRAPKPDPDLTLDRLQGTWRFVNIYWTLDDTLQEHDLGISAVGIEGAQFMIYYRRRSERNVFTIEINPQKKPVTLDLFHENEKTPRIQGILRREGEELHLLYNWDRERPKSFHPPTPGYLLLVLRRPD